METNQIIFRKKPIVLDKQSAKWLVSNHILNEDRYVFNPNPTFEDCKNRKVYGNILTINKVPSYYLLQCSQINVVLDGELGIYNIN